MTNIIFNYIILVTSGIGGVFASAPPNYNVRRNKCQELQMKKSKICPYCKKEKMIYEFSKNKTTKDSLQYYCKLCIKRKYTKNAFTCYKNKYIIKKNHVEIIITSNKYGEKKCLIDIRDLTKIKKYNWHLFFDNTINNYYVLTTSKRKTITIHRYILNIKKNQVDHINRNPLDNRKCNLRKCNSKQNSYNRTPQKNTTSVYKGVSFNKKANKWISAIGYNYNTIYLGIYNNEKKAAKAYNKKAKELFGEYAYLNEV